MTKFKLSAVYSALVLSGLVYVNQAEALVCTSSETRISNQSDSLSNCATSLTTGTLGLATSIIHAENSTVAVSNSNLSIRIDTGSILNLINSTATVNHSQLSASGDGIVDTISLTKSAATLTNTTISTSNEASAFSFEDETNTLTLNDSTINSDSFLDTTWRANGGTEYAKLDLSLNNSSVASKIFTIAPEYDAEDNTTMVERVNITANNSTLSGLIAMPANTSSISHYRLTLNDSTWTTAPLVDTNPDTNTTITHFNKLNELTLNNSTVTLSKAASFQTLTVGNLSGTGNFTMNTDLANQQADKIVVESSDSGSFGLQVNNSRNEPNAPNGKVTLVETQTGTASFRLLGKDYVDAGAYRYRLNKEGNNWVLSNRLSEKTTGRITPSTGTTPVSGITPTSSSSPITTVSNEISLSGTSNALVSLRQAQLTLVENSLDGLHQRLGELKHGEHGNVWVRNVNSRNEFDAMKTSVNSHSSGFKQNVHTVQVGADMTLSDNVRLGGFVGNSRSNIDFAGEYGNGKVRSKAVGIYATYLANNGFYWDNIAKYERIKSESDYTDSRKYNAYTVSTEIGRIHTLGNGWTVTPQLQGAWTTISSKADEDRLSAFTGRAGVRVARIVTLSSWNLQPYAELNAITTKSNTNEIHVNQYSFDVDDARARMQTTLGLNTSIGNHRIGLEGAITQGENLDQPFKIQAVYRYSW